MKRENKVQITNSGITFGCALAIVVSYVKW